MIIRRLIARSALMQAAAFVIICASIVPRCQAKGTEEYICHRALSGISVDGRLEDAAWKEADVIKFVLPITCKDLLSKIEARVLWDDSHLYVAYKAYDKDVWSIFTQRDAPTYQEDCLECFIQPDIRAKAYCNFEINALGTVYDAYNISRFSGGGDHHRWAAWNCDGLRIGISIDGTLNDPSDIDLCWQMELAIPFAELPFVKARKPGVGDVWRFLLGRYDYSVYLPDGVELSSCASLNKVDFHESEEWSRLTFAK